MLFKRSCFGDLWMLCPWWSLLWPLITWWVATWEMCVPKSFSSFEMSFNVDIKLHPPLRIFERLKKWNTYENFRSFAFAIKINQEVRKFDKDSLILIARSRQRFALSVTTSVFVTASDWRHSSYFDFITCKPWHEWLVCYFFDEAEARNIVVLSKVSQTYQGISLPLRSLLFYKINPLQSTFPCFRAFALRKGVACKIKPFCTSGKAEQPPTTHLPGIFRMLHWLQ